MSAFLPNRSSPPELVYASLLGDREIVAFRPVLSRALGSPLAALYLCQAIYWQQIAGEDAWWFKLRDGDRDEHGSLIPPRNRSRQSWEWELGMSRSEQESARRLLKSLKLLEERRMGVPAKLNYKVNLTELGKLLESQYQLAGSCQLDGEIAPSSRQSSASKEVEMRPANSKTTSKNIETNFTARKKSQKENLEDGRWLALHALLEAEIDEKVARDWIALRIAKNAPVTETALEQTKAEARKAGITLQEAILRCCGLGFAGFTADMIKQSKLDQVPESWQTSEKALLAKAKELGIERQPGEITFALKERVREAITGHDTSRKTKSGPPDSTSNSKEAKFHESRAAFSETFKRLKNRSIYD